MASRQPSLKLSSPQHIYLNELKTKFRAFVGGFGSGKTFVGAVDLVRFAIENPKHPQGYFAPTYRDIRDTFWPVIEEASGMMGLSCRIREGAKEVDLFKGRWYYGTIICRPMFDPSTIVGFKVVRAQVDEIDTMTKAKATAAWRKILARMRLKVNGIVNDVGVTTTPEGFRFVYETFGKNPTQSYSMVQASTYENAEYLPDDYIPSLLETYPSQLVKAYLHGEFVNLTQGTVFYAFNRADNNTDVTAKDGEPIKIGMDFNVMKMAAAIYVVREGVWHQTDEYHHLRDTPAMIARIREDWPGRHITVYPDSTGDSRKSNNASVSDIQLLKQAGFEVRVKPTNPTQRDRIIAANSAYERRKVLVNVARCPETTRCLEQLAYDKGGEMDKDNDLDHSPDAATYPIAYEMPVNKPMSRIQVRTSL